MTEEIQTTLGFWFGFWIALFIGMFMGLAIFGVSIIGQGIWDQGIETGRLLCQIDLQRQRLIP
jgi:hypothetical protein